MPSQYAMTHFSAKSTVKQAKNSLHTRPRWHNRKGVSLINSRESLLLLQKKCEKLGPINAEIERQNRASREEEHRKLLASSRQDTILLTPEARARFGPQIRRLEEDYTGNYPLFQKFARQELGQGRDEMPQNRSSFASAQAPASAPARTSGQPVIYSNDAPYGFSSGASGRQSPAPASAHKPPVDSEELATINIGDGKIISITEAIAFANDLERLGMSEDIINLGTDPSNRDSSVGAFLSMAKRGQHRIPPHAKQELILKWLKDNGLFNPVSREEWDECTNALFNIPDLQTLQQVFGSSMQPFRFRVESRSLQSLITKALFLKLLIHAGYIKNGGLGMQETTESPKSASEMSDAEKVGLAKEFVRLLNSGRILERDVYGFSVIQVKNIDMNNINHLPEWAWDRVVDLVAEANRA